MKKLIFTLFVAFFVASLAVNAQNYSKLSHNNDGSVVLSKELKTKFKAKDISEEDYLKRMAVRKQAQQPVQQQNKPTQTKEAKPKVELKTIDKSKLKTKQSLARTKIVEKKAIPQNQKESLAAKAKQMNIDFAKKGQRSNALLKTIGGKQYIQIVESPKQMGMTPPKSNQ